MHSHLDIDECDMETDMCDDDSRAGCNNTLGSYECYCKTGFTGDGVNCTGKYMWVTTHVRFVSVF